MHHGVPPSTEVIWFLRSLFDDGELVQRGEGGFPFEK